ncbi:MAG: STAS domain-containing protein [Planctomycetes bacterium]|nr:STAS domain-containing protein [Planctomycetota bacterium]
MGKAAPSAGEAVEAARVAREAGRLRIAQRALDHALQSLDPRGDPDLAGRAAEEADLLGRALLAQGATLAALGELQRACALGRDGARPGLARVAGDYARWRPRAGPIGAPRDSLVAGASGAFWAGARARGRVVAIEGGITGEGTESFGRILELCARDVQWVFVDMEKLTYVGSAGLAVAVKLAERLRGQGGGLAMFAMSPNLKLLVETLGLAQFLNPAGTLLDALDLACRAG